MMKFWALIFLLTGLSFFSYARKELQFFVDYGRFQNVEGKTYIEIYFSLDPKSLTFKKNHSNTFINQTQIIVAVSAPSDPDKIILADKFILTTELKDTTLENSILWDSKRYYLNANQSYRIEVILKDLSQDSASSYGVVKELEIKKELFSDVLFVESIQKSNSNERKVRYGYEVIPLITNSTFFDKDTLKFWLEIYQSDSVFSVPYYFEYYVIQANQEQKIAETAKVTKPQNGKKLDVLIGKVPIKNLPSQTYWLVIEIKTNDGNLLGIKRQKFFVYNSEDYLANTEHTNLYDVFYGYNEQELDEYLKTLVIIATPTEANFIQSLKTFEEKKNFFVNFWAKRVEANQSPTKPWKEHLSRVQYANAKFSSTIRKGYLTDRGRTLLLYGPPNDLQAFTQDGDKYPYEIWFYNKLGRQQGVIFVFYDPDLITNEYPLLHSNKIGEFNNKSWRNDLLRGKMGTLGADDPEYNKIERTKFRDTLPLEMR